MERLDKCYHWKNDTNKKWDTQRQLYCVLKIYLNYGVLRPSEIIDMKLLQRTKEMKTLII